MMEQLGSSIGSGPALVVAESDTCSQGYLASSVSTRSRRSKPGTKDAGEDSCAPQRRVLGRKCDTPSPLGGRRVPRADRVARADSAQPFAVAHGDDPADDHRGTDGRNRPGRQHGGDTQAYTRFVTT